MKWMGSRVLLAGIWAAWAFAACSSGQSDGGSGGSSATRLGTTGSSLDTLAFKNPDGSIVTVMCNAGSSTKMAILSVGGTKLQLSISGTAWATVKH